jgi:5'-nucleotidase
MSSPKRILIDQDNVLADFDGSFLSIWRDRFPDRPFVPLAERMVFYIRESYPADARADVEAIYTAPGFIRDLPPIPGAIEALQEMKAEGHIVRICTSPLSQYQNCVEEKHAWVENHLGKEWVAAVILANDKTEIRGDTLIDDRPEVRGELEPEWEYVLFDRPWNRNVNTSKRLISWSDWRKVI